MATTITTTSDAITKVVAAIIVFFLNSLIVMLLWNAVLVLVIPGIVGINYWAAMGIYILSNVLFKPLSSGSKS